MCRAVCPPTSRKSLHRGLPGLASWGILLCALAWAPSRVAADVDCGPNSGGTGRLANVKVALHASLFGPNPCSEGAPSGFACDRPYWNYGSSNVAFCSFINTRTMAYVVALDVPSDNGLRGATFGIDFNAYNDATRAGVYVEGFSSCIGQTFPSASPFFPLEPGSGVVLTAGACLNTPDPTDPQGEGYVVLGWFDVTAYDVSGFLAITPRLYMAEPDFELVACGYRISRPCYPAFAGILGFGTYRGRDPCYASHCIDPACPGPPSYCNGPIAARPTSWSALKRRAQ